MKIFKKLIDDLKEENLLEEPVIESNGNYNSENKVPLPTERTAETGQNSFSPDEIASETLADEVAPDNAADEVQPHYADEIPGDVDETGFEFKLSKEENISEEDIRNYESENYETDEELETKEPNTVEFFYRRAKEEVSSLQIVEHILSGVERDRMKIIPNIFDELVLRAKKQKPERKVRLA